MAVPLTDSVTRSIPLLSLCLTCDIASDPSDR